MARAYTPAAFHSMDYHVHSTWIGIAPISTCGGGRRPRSTVDGGAMLLPSSAIRHSMAPLRPAQAPCRLLTANRNRSAPFPPLRSGISGHRRSSHVRALLSAAPSPETLIPPRSLPLPRLPSPVQSNICERTLPPLPSTSSGTSTSTGIGNVGGGDDGDGDDDDDG